METVQHLHDQENENISCENALRHMELKKDKILLTIDVQ